LFTAAGVPPERGDDIEATFGWITYVSAIRK
jgi:hypothetical protein